MTSTTAKCATSLGGVSPARRIARRALLDVPPLPAASPTYRLGFGLFVLVNAVLFVRPAELIPGIADWPIYEVVILACLLASLPAVIRQLTWNSFRRNPITLCVVGLLLAIILSHLTHGDIYDARMG